MNFQILEGPGFTFENQGRAMPELREYIFKNVWQRLLLQKEKIRKELKLKKSDDIKKKLFVSLDQDASHHHQSAADNNDTLQGPRVVMSIAWCDVRTNQGALRQIFKETESSGGVLQSCKSPHAVD